MLVIRLNRTGRKNRASFRLTVQEKTVAPGGRHVEIVGSWDPHKKVATLKNDRIEYWLGKGAQPSDTVYNLLISQGAIQGNKRAVKMEKPKAKEEVKEEAQPAIAEDKKEENAVKEEVEVKPEVKEEVKETAKKEEVKEV